MSEYADEVAKTGVFADPRLIYDLTTDEIGLTIQGKNAREKELQRAENIRIGTVCAGIYNQHRSKASAKIWKWNDFFPERDLREKRSDDELQDRAKKIMEMFNRGGKCR
jgi:hypothetical protein